SEGACAGRGSAGGGMGDSVGMPMDERQAGVGGPHGDRLGRIGESLIWCLLGAARDPQLRRVFSILFMKCEYVADMGPLLQRNREGMRDALRNVEADLAQGVANGQLPADLDTWRATLMLHTLVSGVVRDMRMLPGEIDAGRHAGKLVDGGVAMPG
ncbi:TetR family transcriptional regulator, partial [Burkholderia mallei]|uniref:TetR family transcriptional regulator n=1 Tax=Burkholderia mallei TaxID=13373 RepID=UPI0007A0AAFA